MGKEVGDEFVSKAIKHAKVRWCLDDEGVVREWCERRTVSDTPEELVDAFAIDYGLVDPQDEVEAARAVRQLLGEYKDVLGNLRENVLAHLPPGSRR
jgi:hypothetical protein